MKAIRTSCALLLAVGLVLAGCQPAMQDGSPGQRPPGKTPEAGSGPAGQPTTAAEMGQTRLVDRPDEIITRLDSGLTVLVKRYPAAPVVSVRMLVRAGSILEDRYSGAGISHLFEHLLAGATTARRTRQQTEETLNRIGAVSNAYTSYDRTVYQIDVPAVHAGAAIDLVADWVTRPTFPDSDVNREWGVVQRELEMYAQDPARVFNYKAMETRYRVHPARFPVVGQKAALARLTRQDILSYYRKMYVPGNVVVAVVGDLDPEATLTRVCKEFSDFTARPVPPVYVPAEPPVTAPRTVVYPMDVAQVRFAIGFPTVDVLSDDMYPLDVMADVLAAGESSRLPLELAQRRRLALAVGASSWTPQWADGSFLVEGMCQSENWPALREAILGQLQRLKDTPLSEQDLARAKRQAVVRHIRNQQTSAEMAEELGGDLLTLGDAHFDDRYVARLNRVTAAQVQAAARDYFDTNKLLTTLIVPRGFVVQGPGSGGAGVAASQPERAIVVGPIRKVVLDNGLTVLLRRNTAVPLVAVQVQFAGGVLAERAEQNGVCQLMVRSAQRGTKTRTGEQIFAAFETAGGTLGGGSGRNTFWFSASVLADQLTATLPVLADVITQPAFSPDEVDKARRQSLAAIARTDEQLTPAANRFFFAKMFPGHNYGWPVMGQADTVAKLTATDLEAFHGQWVVGRNGVLAIFGDIDLDATEKLVRQLFGKAALPAGPPGLAIPKDSSEQVRILADRVAEATWPKPPASPAGNGFFVHPTKLAEQAEIDMGFPGVLHTDPDYYALTMMSTMLGGYYMPGGWLHETLRGRQLVYEVHISNIAWRQAGLLYITAKCPPDKVRQSLDAIDEQLDRARRGEFAADQLANAKSEVLAAELMALQTNDQQATQCALDEVLGWGYDNHLKLGEHVNAVTLDDVKRVARKYLTHAVTTVTTCDPAAAEAPKAR